MSPAEVARVTATVPRAETAVVGGAVLGFADCSAAGYSQFTVAGRGVALAKLPPRFALLGGLESVLWAPLAVGVAVLDPPCELEPPHPLSVTSAAVDSATKTGTRRNGLPIAQAFAFIEVMVTGILGAPPPALIEPSSPPAATLSMTARPGASMVPNTVYCGGSGESL